MSYTDCISHAIQHAFDLDIPSSLLGNTIVSEAAMLAGQESDRMGSAIWD